MEYIGLFFYILGILGLIINLGIVLFKLINHHKISINVAFTSIIFILIIVISTILDGNFISYINTPTLTLL